MTLIRENLPAPLDYFQSRGQKIFSKHAKDFRTSCAVHGGTNGNLSVDKTTGTWFCFKCEAKGADVLDYVRQADKLSFEDAARKLGAWQDDDQKEPPKRTAKPAEPARKPAPERQQLTPDQVQAVFDRFEQTADRHPYCVKKALGQDVTKLLRVVPNDDPLTTRRGWLAVPALDATGAMLSVQFVPCDGGGKMNLACAPMAGGRFTVGPPAGPVVVVEGLGHAEAIYAATGGRAVASFGSGNMRRVVESLRQQEPGTDIIVLPDRGKEGEARQIASEFNCLVVCLPECEPDNFDINDLFLRDGFAVVQALLDTATETPKPVPLLRPVSVFDVLTDPSEPPAFVWDGYLPNGEVSLLGAHGGTGKSTIGLMLAVCAALGRPLFGVDTQQCKSLFVGLEDSTGILRHRLASICRAWLIDPAELRDTLMIVDGSEHPELFTAENRGSGDITSTHAELRELVKAEGFGLVLIDNASDAFAGDEIVRKQVRAFVRQLKLLATSTGCAVLLLAHVDKGTSRARKAEGDEAYSGSTAWHNSVRSRLFMSRGDDGLIKLEHHKSNLGKRREPLTLNWLDGGLPQVVGAPGLAGAMQPGRADDLAAAALLRLMAEFEGRGQYCSPVLTARNNVHAVLRSEPDFQNLKLHQDDVKRIVNQCQRAGWIEPTEYQKADRKPGTRWLVTPQGRVFAGMPAASAASAVSCHKEEQTAQAANSPEPPAASAACSPRGYGGIART